MGFDQYHEPPEGAAEDGSLGIGSLRSAGR
jgi:hypothetical protein